MSGCLASSGFRDGYSTGDSDLLSQFYSPALHQAVSYDRAAGYFSSALIALAPDSFADFVRSGGRMRLVCSPHLSEADAQALSPTPSDEQTVLRALERVATRSDLSQALLVALSSLIGAGVLEIKFAVPVHGHGIFHDKIGIFRDTCAHSLSFVGSANETAAAWSGLANHEQIEVFRDWVSDEQARRVRRHERGFEHLWRGLARGLRLVDADQSSAIVGRLAPPEDVELSLTRVQELIDVKSRSTTSQPAAVPLREHQTAVLEDWEANGHSGLVVFATGGGKTLTGIEAMRRWTRTGRPCLALVPSALLHNQWADEIRREIPTATLLLAGAGSRRSDWVRALRAATGVDDIGRPRITLATYQTALTDDFRTRVADGEHLLIVADEVHRMGAPDTRALFELQSGGRLGLSATPARYGDAEGTAQIVAYFGRELSPRFELKDALKSDPPVLVPYDYFVERVSLTDDEQEEWQKLSASLAQEIARNDGAISDYARHLARQRARVVKSADGKAPLAEQVIEREWRDGDRWLVYCDDRNHLDSVRKRLERLRIPIFEYHSGNSILGPEVIRQFSRGGILLAIKCLDEGVDLPYVNKALILASTTNPREYIQRRGRVLRRAPGKRFATIFDALVLGSDGVPVMVKEIDRAQEFADLASNKAGALSLQVLKSSLRLADQIDLPEEVDLGDE